VRSEAGIDGGEVIMSLNVPIPSDLIHDLVNGAEINMLAKALQQHVLRYEHLILPGAVNILAQMCLDARKTNPH
jgi:folate-dependent phosphoribosylglycinamide formyltransferase PurN